MNEQQSPDAWGVPKKPELSPIRIVGKPGVFGHMLLRGPLLPIIVVCVMVYSLWMMHLFGLGG